MKLTTRNSLIAAVSLAASVAVIIPIQSYLGNSDLYPFSLVRLLPELLAIFAAFAGGLFALGLLGDRFRVPVSSWLVALLLCVYLESGLLSAGIPELNGGYVKELENFGFGIADSCIWVGLLAAFGLCSRWLKPYLHWIAAAVLLLMCASLFDVKRVEALAEGEMAKATGYENQPTVVANVKYSPTRNVLVFILDSMPGENSAEVMRNNAELRRKFPGFTAYPRNIGMHECTKRGIPGLLTGEHFDPAKVKASEYPMTMYGESSFVTAASRAGWNVAFSPDLLPYGFTNLPVERRVSQIEKQRSRDALAVLRRSREVPYLSLIDMVVFRITPYFFKSTVLYSRIRHAVSGRHSADEFWKERTLYPQLAKRPVNSDAKPFLGVFHSFGAHPPWNGNLKSVITENLERLAQLMDEYRASGVYDRSMIIVTADHGLDMATPVKGYPASASALLWVKPQGESGEYAEDGSMTSHARISALVKQALAKPPSSAECRETLKCDAAYYRAFRE